MLTMHYNTFSNSAQHVIREKILYMLKSFDVWEHVFSIIVGTRCDVLHVRFMYILDMHRSTVLISDDILKMSRKTSDLLMYL